MFAAVMGGSRVRDVDQEEFEMAESLYQRTTSQVAARRRELAPGIHEAFDHFSRVVCAEGALPEKTSS